MAAAIPDQLLKDFRNGHLEGGSRWRRMTDEEKVAARAKYAAALKTYREYQLAVEAYTKATEDPAIRKRFDDALKELQDRGLLQRDNDNECFDMHPVVWGNAAEGLTEQEKQETFLTARDYFAGLPPDDLENATEVSQVVHTLELYHCLIGAGLLDEAANFLIDKSGVFLDNLGVAALYLELAQPFFGGGIVDVPTVSSPELQSSILLCIGNAYGIANLGSEGMVRYEQALQLNVRNERWSAVAYLLLNIGNTLYDLNQLGLSSVVINFAHELTVAIQDSDAIMYAYLLLWRGAVQSGSFEVAAIIRHHFIGMQTQAAVYFQHGSSEHIDCAVAFWHGELTNSGWQSGYQCTVQHRRINYQHQFLSLRCEWLLTLSPPVAETALEAIDDALKMVNRNGTASPAYHDLRAWALAKLNRPDDAKAELARGEKRLYAAEAWKALGDREEWLACTLNAYTWAWGEGPPYIHWYTLKRSRELLAELGHPEPKLPDFDPTKVKPIPYEKEIRAAIERLKAEKAEREKKAAEGTT
jgi:hypothetical protein